MITQKKILDYVQTIFHFLLTFTTLALCTGILWNPLPFLTDKETSVNTRKQGLRTLI